MLVALCIFFEVSVLSLCILPIPAGYACALAAFTRATSISNATSTPALAFAFCFYAYSTVYLDATYASMAEDS